MRLRDSTVYVYQKIPLFCEKNHVGKGLIEAVISSYYQTLIKHLESNDDTYYVRLNGIGNFRLSKVRIRELISYIKRNSPDSIDSLDALKQLGDVCDKERNRRNEHCKKYNESMAQQKKDI